MSENKIRLIVLFILCVFSNVFWFIQNDKLIKETKSLQINLKYYKQKENTYQFILNQLNKFNKNQSENMALALYIQKAIKDIDSKFEFLRNPNLIIAIIQVESNFNRVVVSRAGAIGYMQVKQSTANWLYKKFKLKVKPDLYKGYNNIYYGLFYLNYLAEKLSKKYPLSVVPSLVLIAYNEGPNSKAVKNISFNNHKYIKKVLEKYIYL